MLARWLSVLEKTKIPSVFLDHGCLLFCWLHRFQELCLKKKLLTDCWGLTFVFYFFLQTLTTACSQTTWGTMAQFGFENDIHNVLKLDMPITNAPMPRWQRKASTSTSKASGPLSPGNRSVSTSKTPNKTPGKLGLRMRWFAYFNKTDVNWSKICFSSIR